MMNFIEDQLPEFNKKKTEQIVKILHQVLPTSEPLSIIDVGCGTGELLTIPLASRLQSETNITLLGTDIHQESIQRAQENAAQLNLRNVLFKQIAIGSCSKDQFNVAICSEVLEHVEAYEQFIVDIKNCLCQDGLLILTIPNGYGAYELESFVYRRMGVEKLLRMIWRLYRRIRPKHPTLSTRASLDFLIQETLNHENNHHINFFSLSFISQLLTKQNFKVEICESVRFLGGPVSSLLLEKIAWMREWNYRIGRILPVRVAAGWVIVARRVA